MDYSPSGDELEAAALHAAGRCERHERLAAEWGDELLRLAELATEEGGHRGLLGQIADAAGLTRASFSARLRAWRRRNGLGG